MEKSNIKHENDLGKSNNFSSISPTQQQQLYSPNSMDRLQYKHVFNPSYSIPPEQQENTTIETRYHWQNSPNLSIASMQQLNPTQAFGTIYDTSYASPQQNHTVINGQYNYHHRGSLPIIPTASDSFMPSVEQESELDMANGAPYVRRHTESSILSKQAISRKQKNNDKQNKKLAAEGNEEERRKHFLERNRQAALKCRQRKKQWLADLQHRVEFLSTDNEQLQSQATMLREEVINLKTLLLAHRDCRVAQSNGTTVGMIQSISSNLTVPFNSAGVISPSNDMLVTSELAHSQQHEV
ncbi:hypothetical protein BD560DRAFT_380687 [Blakeslea trispora]|nr:hypothetical protein BD560DRAFT_380687 [Blakeslea trispora]